MSFNRDLFSKLIRIKIAEEQMTYREVSKILGLCPATISRIAKKNGKGLPDVVSLYKACTWLGVMPNDFLKPTRSDE